MRGVGAEVIFDRLLVADVNEYIAEYAGMATFVHRDEQAALQHVLQQPYGFQADRLSAGVGTGDDENTLFSSSSISSGITFSHVWQERVATADVPPLSSL